MPALGTEHQVSEQFLDYSGERKAVTISVGVLNVTTLPTFITQLATWRGALNAVCLGTNSLETWGDRVVISNTRPTDKTAQIETEMLMTYQDATTEEPASLRITTVNYDAFNYADPPAGDTVIISGDGASATTLDLIDAFEALAKFPGAPTHGVVVTGMRVVR